MVPSAAAKALPERPATITAASRGPISRNTAMDTMSTTKMRAPKRSSWLAPW
ncbi:hypothetical protein D3C83_109880 [compost metagenome]